MGLGCRHLIGGGEQNGRQPANGGHQAPLTEDRSEIQKFNPRTYRGLLFKAGLAQPVENVIDRSRVVIYAAQDIC